ncbi:MAG TPA: prepilin-type N-terminal cleavage/methylation domain-containing protein [Candidatus Limnocylindrales bacterium]|nr:prepilin-type N-terminal cleavage/methylation domain-containing protein [Candidatus Limnocylindrales bacterium]
MKCPQVSHSESGPGDRVGFSLLELLLVVVIILILTTLYWSPNRANRQMALQSACRNNLQKIYIAMEIYANDHGGKFPIVGNARTSAQGLEPLVPRYTSDTSIFVCPGSSDSAPSGQSIRNRAISYAYYMGRAPTNQEVVITDRQVDSLQKAAGQFVFSANGKPPGNNHRQFGGNFLFCDGRVEASSPKTSIPLGLSAGEVLLNP